MKGTEMPHLPTVFLSSTCFDLQQVRADIVNFIQEDLGYRCLASEMNSFPIAPDADTVENCRRRVDQDADALVLVIGGRYGVVPEALGRSITNLEYLVARAKGIPLFVFVKADVLALLPVWKDNPAADFKGVVDDSRLFEFISEIRGPHSVWMQPFTVARDIIAGLRQQFAYLMSQGLSLQRQLQGSPKEYSGFSGRALRIALERPLGWQGLLLAQLVEDELANVVDLRLAYDTSVSFGPGERVADAETSEWQQASLDQASRLADGLQRLLNEALTGALEAKDSLRIASCARLIGGAYRDALEWALGLRRAHVADDWRPVVREMSLFTRDIILKLEGLPELLRRYIGEAVTGIGAEETRTVSLMLKLTISNLDGYEKAMGVLRRERQR